MKNTPESTYYLKASRLRQGLAELEHKLFENGNLTTEDCIEANLLLSEARGIELNWIVFRLEKMLLIPTKHDAGKVITCNGKAFKLASCAELENLFKAKE